MILVLLALLLAAAADITYVINPNWGRHNVGWWGGGAKPGQRMGTRS